MHEFFTKYAHLSLHGEAAELAELYGAGFVVAGPKGTFGGLNDEAFLAWLTQVQQGSRDSGMRGLRPARVAAPLPVGPNHCLVEVEWAALFGEREVVFAISYLLQNDGPRIIGYVSHEDQAERMAAEGLHYGT